MLKTAGSGCGSIVKLLMFEHPAVVNTVVVYTPGTMPPVELVCVNEKTPKGMVDHVMVYPGLALGGLKVRPRLNAFKVPVHVVCVAVGAVSGCGLTVTVEREVSVTTALPIVVPVT